MGYSTSARDQLAGLGVHHFRRDLDRQLHRRATGVALALHEASLVTAAAMAVGVLAGLVLFVALAWYQVRQFGRVTAAEAAAS
jgi:hypothetical protein